ncbi:MAG: hypothetical protein M3R30_03580 [Candidatus Eremiobacteraeota bacterium]|nr:hypothetical protein [Candidatus Eremiobacteraeota bacterium]
MPGACACTSRRRRGWSFVDGATRERSSISFGEITPGGRAEARLGLRLLRELAKTCPVTVDVVPTADATLPVALERLTIETTTEPDSSVGTFQSELSESVDVVERIEWTLHARNRASPARSPGSARTPRPPGAVSVDDCRKGGATYQNLNRALS